MGSRSRTFHLAAYFRVHPREIFEAARWSARGRAIVLPQSRAAPHDESDADVGWCSYRISTPLIALTFTTKPDLATIQVGLLSLSDQYGSTQYGPLFAAISINIIVLLVVFVFLNKKIMAGLAAGSLKG
jgi:raffinose/stachyose/melibiose transport system permease protein